MRAKTNQLNKGFNLKQFTFNGNIQKKTQEIKKSSTMAKKAKDLLKKNLHFFMKGKFSYESANHPLITYQPEPNEYTLPQSDEDDQNTHDAVTKCLARPYALHASMSWQPSDSDDYKVPSVDKIPRSWKDTMQPEHLAAYNLNKKQLQFQELIYEIVLTEQSYLDDLILTYKIFIEDSLAWKGLPDATKLLFASIHPIIILHVQFLAILKERQSQTQLVYSITDIFTIFAQNSNIYTAYFANFEKANNEITECIRSHDLFGSYITRRQAWPECRNLPLAAYLLTPLQRMMKYPLFFNSLLDCLEDNDFRVPDIKLLISELDTILNFFNQQQKFAEDFTKLENLEMRIKGLDGCSIAVPGRKLIHEGFLNIIVPSSSELPDLTLTDDVPSSLVRRGSTYSQKPTLSRRNSTISQTPSLLRRSSTFSLAPRKKEVRAYVFLFNDLIVFTKISKHKFTSKNINVKKGSFYGPSPDSMFKVIHAPGELSGLSTSLPNDTVRSGSIFGGLFRQPSLSSLKHSTPQDDQTHQSQFKCTVGMMNFHLEADTIEEKDTWYGHMAQVIENIDKKDTSNDSTFPQININTDQFFYESDSSASILTEDDDDDEITVPAAEETMDFEDKNDDLQFTSSITDAFFTDSIWSAGDSTDLAAFELTSAFEDIL